MVGEGFGLGLTEFYKALRFTRDDIFLRVFRVGRLSFFSISVTLLVLA